MSWHLLDVGIDDVAHALLETMASKISLVGLHAQGLHQDATNGIWPEAAGTVTISMPSRLLLDKGEGPMTFLLGENLGDLELGAIALVGTRP